QTWAAAAAPSSVRPEATERSGLEVPVHSPYTHSNQLQHPLTPERRRARMEYRSTRAVVLSIEHVPAGSIELASRQGVSCRYADSCCTYGCSWASNDGRQCSTWCAPWDEFAPRSSHESGQTVLWTRLRSGIIRGQRVVPSAGLETGLPVRVTR